MDQLHQEGGENQMAVKVNTGLYIDKRVKDRVDACARETAKRHNFTKRTEWGFAKQVEAMLAQAVGIDLSSVKPYFPSVKPSHK